MRKLIVFKSRVIADETRDMAAPGHVLRNDRDSGESWVRCARGVLALRRCRYEGETEDFEPGKKWSSIRIRLGLRVDDWLWDRIRAGETAGTFR